jgi:hypothetical protein
MILAFADDSTVTAMDDIAQANTHCEVGDVENGVYTFLDECGAILRPAFPTPTRRTILGGLCSPGNFTLSATQERRPELLQAICNGAIIVEPGPRIRTSEQLIRELKKCTC